MELTAGTMVTSNVRLVELLGEGGMGSVWIADHLTLDTQVAVKFISRDLLKRHPALAARFNFEAKAAAQIRSPYVVQIFDHGLMEDGTPFMVMERLHGESLGERLEQGRPALREAGIIVAQVAKALTAAHKLKVIHRDIKPDNIFLLECDDDDEVFVKVLDFGIAKRTDQSKGLTDTGSMLGTPDYMSPEQIMDVKGVDHRADVWALAVVAYELLTLRMPFVGETVGATLMAITNFQWILPSKLDLDVPQGFDEWFIRAFHRDRNQRWASAREAAKALIPLCTDHPSSIGVDLGDSSDDLRGESERAEAMIAERLFAGEDDTVPGSPAPLPTEPAGPMAVGQASWPETAVPGDSEEKTAPAQPEHGQTKPETFSGASSTLSHGPAPLKKPLRKPLVIGLAAIVLALVVVGTMVVAEWGNGQMPLAASKPTVSTNQASATDEERSSIRMGIQSYSLVARHDRADKLTRFLTEELGREVVMLRVDSFAELMTKLTNGQLEAGFLPSYSYVTLQKKSPGIRLLATQQALGKDYYQGVIIAKESSGISSLQGLRDKVFCYVRFDSASGYLFPRALFLKNGIDPDSFFKSTRFTGAHLTSLKDLDIGRCDGVAVYNNVFSADEEIIRMADVGNVVLAHTERIPWDAVVGSPKISKTLAVSIRAALLKLKPGSDEAKDTLGETNDLNGYVTAKDSDY
ncbi:PhnD/SsuA/transferrin family substrate-binding protein, partial [Desulfobulbus sp. AH-315-M07]|nr:PhnD/SsuA/transferrin family substrate-binding protein [Desulfobulbus sp. AH-315-M07]